MWLCTLMQTGKQTLENLFFTRLITFYYASAQLNPCGKLPEYVKNLPNESCMHILRLAGVTCALESVKSLPIFYQQHEKLSGALRVLTAPLSYLSGLRLVLAL